MAEYIELFVDQGSNFTSNLVITNVASNAATNVASAILTANIKRSHYSSNVAGAFTCTKLDSANGIISISLPSATTINLSGRYVYSVKMLSSNATTIIVGGSLFISPQT